MAARCWSVVSFRSATWTMRIASLSWSARDHKGALAARSGTTAQISSRRLPREHSSTHSAAAATTLADMRCVQSASARKRPSISRVPRGGLPSASPSLRPARAAVSSTSPHSASVVG